MSLSPTIQTRHESPVAFTETETSRSAIATNTTRLRSWAAVRGFELSGAPYLWREDGRLLVGVPTRRMSDPHPETGVRASVCPAGTVAIAEPVSLDTFLSDPAAAVQVPGDGRLDLPRAEFHLDSQTLNEGTLVVPIRI